MREFKGTPGPWRLDKYGNVVHGQADGFGINKSVRVSGVAIPGQTTAEYEANTRLLAAAPELLEALRGLIALYEHDEGCRQIQEYKRAKAAMAKALGA